MRKWNLAVLVLIVGLAPLSCASSSGYTHFVIDADHDSLRAHSPKDDLPLRATCEPDAKDKAKCIAMLNAEFFKMETELLELRAALKECQKGPQP